MLASTFRYISGIRRQTEAKLWREGVFTLDQLLESELKQLNLFRDDASQAAARVNHFKSLVQSRDFEALAELFDSEDYYRVALHFPEDTIFLDIETTGLSRHYDKITLVGWQQSGHYDVYIRGGDPSAFLKAIERASIVVTYNGTTFDLPFILKEFPNAQLPPVHVDLRYLSKRVGLTGGQKTVEQLIGVSRLGEVNQIDGEFAPVLWAQYRRGDMGSIRRLIEYNHADVAGLCAIFDDTARRMLKKVEAPAEIVAKLPIFCRPCPLLMRAVADPTRAPRAGAVSVFPYVPSDSSFTTLKSLYKIIGRNDLTIIGIDLTGSEARESGWCKLHKFSANTRLIATDHELIEATVAAHPDLVSIDSPLSLPKGRKTVFDDDPGRVEFGIMRTCERVLKRRGINVYPSLLPSMQRLTARGIRLAAELRRRGVPVIESYPGAAQDIMNIPRKRAGLDLLKAGLREFGVCGEFLRSDVSHDELDAITSALVGVFFFAGKFEVLGDEEEEALVVPDIAADPSRWLTRVVVGFSGGLASGKTSAARLLEQHGFAYGRYSMVLSQALAAKGLNPTREALQEYGLHVNKELGQRWLGRQVLRSLASNKNLVIDGMRFPEDFALLTESFGLSFEHVYIETAREKRRIRYELRGGAKEEFDAAETHEVESATGMMKSLHRVKIIENESDLTRFLRAIQCLARTTICQ